MSFLHRANKQIRNWFLISRKLRRMERALGIKLTPTQRAAVLSPERPSFAHWGRATGKSLCAALWLLLHTKGEVDFFQCRIESRLPDPDMHLSRAVQIWTYRNLYDIYQKVHSAGIKTCTVVPPHCCNMSALMRWEREPCRRNPQF